MQRTPGYQLIIKKVAISKKKFKAHHQTVWRGRFLKMIIRKFHTLSMYHPHQSSYYQRSALYLEFLPAPRPVAGRKEMLRRSLSWSNGLLFGLCWHLEDQPERQIMSQP